MKIRGLNEGSTHSLHYLNHGSCVTNCKFVFIWNYFCKVNVAERKSHAKVTGDWGPSWTWVKIFICAPWLVISTPFLSLFILDAKQPQYWFSNSELYTFPIRGSELRTFKEILREYNFNKIYFIKVQRIQQNSIILRPEMENPAQRLQNLQMKY